MDLSDVDEKFGPGLRAARESLQMKQDDLATKAQKYGVALSQATIGKIERGERRVTLGEAEALAQAVGHSALSLARGASEVTLDSQLRGLRKLRDQIKEAVMSFESGQQLIAMSSDYVDLTPGLAEDRDHSIMESAEDVLEEYRKDRLAENAHRAHRDSLDGSPLSGDVRVGPQSLLKVYYEKFGDRVTHIPDEHAAAVLYGGKSDG
jgi:transcriptional regulator with XRE-family HTH domain